MRIQRLVVAVLMVAMLGAGAGQAVAQPDDAKAAAEQLFDQGYGLMKQGEFAAACGKFEASLELDPALGTLLNLANCYEQVGKLASAWARYREVADLAARDRQRKRVRFARKRAAALEPRLPGLVIQVSDVARVPGLAVTRDGALVDGTLLGTPVYVDPGEHEVTAEAPGYASFATTVTVMEAQESIVEVPVLEPVPEPPADPAREHTARAPGSAPRGAPGMTGETDTNEAGGLASVSSGTQPSAPNAGRTRRILGLAAGGVGLAALAGGLGLGWSAGATWNDAFESGQCNRDTLTCTPEGQQQTDAARMRANLSNVLVGAGVALAATGVVLYLTTPDDRSDERVAHLVPMATPDALGFAITGGF